MSHPNNLPKRVNGAAPVVVELPPLGLCTACLADRKMAEARGGDALPEPRPAICIVNATGSCYQHLVVQQQSPLAGPNGAPVSRLLGPNG